MAESDLMVVRVSGKEELDALASQFNLTADEVQKIAVSAINRTVATTRTAVIRRLRAEININRSDIVDYVTAHKASYASMTGDVTISRAPIPLARFAGSRQTKAGASVLVRKSKGREVLKGAFIVAYHNASGNDHEEIVERDNTSPRNGPNVGKVLVRHGKNGRKPGDPKYFVNFPGRQHRAAGRFVLKRRMGLTLTGYLTHAPDVVREEQERAAGVLSKNLASQLQRRLAQRARAQTRAISAAADDAAGIIGSITDAI